MKLHGVLMVAMGGDREKGRAREGSWRDYHGNLDVALPPRMKEIESV